MSHEEPGSHVPKLGEGSLDCRKLLTTTTNNNNRKIHL